MFEAIVKIRTDDMFLYPALHRSYRSEAFEEGR